MMGLLILVQVVHNSYVEMERQANYFAAALILPRKHFLYLYKARGVY
ncbi:ImmA/IrrE family metallo-endopeptidase [Ureibacillus thermosphaericus]